MDKSSACVDLLQAGATCQHLLGRPAPILVVRIKSHPECVQAVLHLCNHRQQFLKQDVPISAASQAVGVLCKPAAPLLVVYSAARGGKSHPE
jgi:hypothetical protein